MVKLVVLDVNGLMCYKYYDKNKRETIIKIRPNVKEFLDELSQEYDIAIYSSTTFPNVSKIISMIYGDEKHKFKFTWCRDRTEFIDLFDVNNHKTLKKLKRIWRCPSVNDKKLYNETNTIIIDDDEFKVKCNNSKNYILINGYVGKDENDDIFELKTLIENKFNEL